VKLFVGGLRSTTTSDRLAALFAGAPGFLGAQVITDRATGLSRRFGYVEFASDRAAVDAQEQFNGAELDGNRIRIEIAKPRPAERWA